MYIVGMDEPKVFEFEIDGKQYRVPSVANMSIEKAREYADASKRDGFSFALWISSACCVAPLAISCTAFDTSSAVWEIWSAVSASSMEELLTEFAEALISFTMVRRRR